MRKLTIYTTRHIVFQPIIDVSRYTAIHIRLSDEEAAEKAPFSRASQLKLVDFAMALRGETDTKLIRIYDEKDSVSGQLPINKRKKIKQLYADIERGEIGSVIVIAADRLFHDQYGIQDGTFIKKSSSRSIKHSLVKVYGTMARPEGESRGGSIDIATAWWQTGTLEDDTF